MQITVPVSRLLADSNSAVDSGSAGGGHGGAWITSSGQLNAEGDVTTTGSDLFASAGQVDSVVVESDGVAVQVLAAGNIVLGDGSNTPANAATLINGAVETTGSTATIDISGEHNVEFGSFGHVTSVDGAITITADTSVGASGGAVEMADGVIVSSGTGEIEITADGNITLGSVSTGNTSSNAIELTTSSGAVVDGGDTDVDVVANVGGLVIHSENGVGIGLDGAIELSVAVIDVENSTANNIHLLESDDIGVLNLSNLGPGDILLDSVAGTITVVGGESGITANGNVRLGSQAQDVIINADVDSGTGNITLDAGNDLVVNSAVTTGGAGTIYLTAGNQITVGSQLTSDNGDILVDASDDITQTASINSTSGDVGLIAGGNVIQGSTGDITTGGDVLVEAGNDWTMAGDTVIAAGGGEVAGQALFGDLTLGEVNATNVSLTSGGSIIDANAGSMNVTADSLSLRSEAGLIGDHDNTNGIPGQNDNAIDIAVATLAANAESGIYILESDALTITTVAAVTVNVGSAVRVNFNSTTTNVGQSRTTTSMEDLSTDADGPIKLVSQAGSITVDGGSDGQGVSAAGSGDILLEAASDVIINADVDSGTGNITLDAGNDLVVNSAVTTGGAGTIYLTAGNQITVGSQLTSDNGDILVDASDDITQTASINSTSGDVGLIAGGNVIQGSTGDITTGGDVLVEAGNDWTMAGDTVIAAGGGEVAGQALFGDLTLGEVNATNVSLTSGGSIIDANAGSMNVTADSLSLRSEAGLIGDHDNTNGIPGQNDNAIDIAVATLAANAESGIYILESDALTITTVAAVTVNVGSAVRVNFNSTTTNVGQSRTTTSMEDLSTDADGPIKLVSQAGSITVDGGSDGQGVSAAGSGDILLEAASDVIINADVDSGTGNITLDAGNDLVVNSAVTTGGAGTIYLTAGNQVTVGSQLTSDNGDILVDASGDITQTASINSTSGDVGLIAGGNVIQGSTGDITTGGDVLVEAGNDWTMAGDTVIAAGGGEVAGQALFGDLTLGEVNATNVSLTSGGSIIDANAGSMNVTADSLSLRSEAGLIGDHDNTNGIPGQNDNAIDIAVATLAANAESGIYILESDALTITTVAAVTVNVGSAVRVNFNSTTTNVGQSRTTTSMEDLSTDADGPIKLVSQAGSITVDGGSDGQGVSAAGSGDILLEAASDVIINADVDSGTGNITLDAGNDLVVNSAVTTGGAGTIYLTAGNQITVGSQLTSDNGDILVDASDDITQTASINSTSGDVGLIAGGNVIQGSTGDITTGGDVLVEAGNDWTMAGDTVIAAGGGEVAGQALFGDLTLGEVNATNVSLTSGGSIIDANAGSMNVTADSLSLRSEAGLIGDHDNTNGIPGQNDNAIDIAVATLAANAESGIYILESDALTITTVAAVTVNVGSAVRVNFNSTTTNVGQSRTTTSMEDLSTDADGPIKLVSQAGSITVDGGSDGQGVSAAGSGDILLEAASDVIINADVDSGTGNITLDAGNDLVVNSAVTTGGAGTIYLTAGNQITVGSQLTSDNGDILVDASDDITQTASINSTSGDVGLIAGGNVIQGSTGDITTGGDVLVEAGNDWTMAGDTVIAAGGGEVAGQALFGDLTLGEVNATNVSLTSGGSIIDANAGSMNVTADSLSLRSEAGLIGDHDNTNGIPGQNDNAIDIAVATLAANAESGIYILESDALTITTVAAVTVNVGSAVRVNFNSTTTNVGQSRTTTSMEDLSTDADGPIKLVSQAGSITVDGGSDGQGVSAAGSGDILLEAASDVIINADVDSGTGNITLDAGNDLVVNSAVTTGGAGTIYLTAGNQITVGSQLTSDNGDILVDASDDITQTASINSTSGDVGLIAGGNVIQGSTGDITTGGDVLVEAGNDWTMAGDTVIAAGGGEVAGQALFGDLTLGEVNATNVSLTSGGSIIDANAGSMNVTADSLSLRSEAGLIGDHDNTNGIPGQNDNAIDIAVATLAANAESGIYILESDALTITTVAAVTVNVGSAVRVNFNSTTTNVGQSRTTTSMEDLSTDADGPIKLVSQAGSITVDGGSDGQGVSAAGSGDILLEAASDVIINADVDSGTGNITLDAGNDLVVNSAVTTGGAGTIYLTAGNQITVGSQLTSDNGDILVDASDDITQTASINSTSGDVGLIAGGNVIQGSTGDITTGGDVLVEAGNDWTMAGDTVIAAGGGEVAGQALFGDLTLGEVNATNVSLTSGGSIIDANAGSMNVTADSLSLRSEAGLIGDHDNTNGIPGQNDNAIDIAVATLAANAESGIYILESDALTITTVAAVTVNVGSAVRVNFNSTTTNVGQSRTTTSMEDLSTDADGPIKLVSQAGSITVDGGSDGQGVSAAGSGDILLEAASDVIINADVDSGTGNITLDAGNDLVVNSL